MKLKDPFTATLVPAGFHTREFSDPKVNDHKGELLPEGCIHIHEGKMCGKIITTARPNGWLCGYHDSICFPKPVRVDSKLN